jgi:hypothetical protein
LKKTSFDPLGRDQSSFRLTDQLRQDPFVNQSPIGRTDTGCESGIAAVLEGRNMTKKDAQSPVNYNAVPHDKVAP